MKFLKKLKPDPFTSLCTGFNQIIDLKITWTLILTDHDGNNHKYYSEDFFSFKTSASVRWFSLESLCLSRIRRIRIIASTPLFYNFKSKKALGRTSTKSLIYDEKFNWSKVNVTNIAGDDRIDIYYIRSNLMLAAWKGNDEAAFWHYLLPCQDLLDRCLKGNVERYTNLIARKFIIFIFVTSLISIILFLDSFFQVLTNLEGMISILSTAYMVTLV